MAPAKDGWVRVSSYIRRQGDVYVTRSTGGKPDEARHGATYCI